MNYAVKLFLVAGLALMLVPHSFANELLPPDIIRMLEAPAIQPDSLGSPHNPKDVKTSGKQGTNSSLQHSTLNELLPPDIISMLETPAYPDVLATKDSPKNRGADNSGDVEKSEN